MVLLQCRIPTKNVYIIHGLESRLQINLAFLEILLFVCLLFAFSTFANDEKTGLEKNQQYWLDLQFIKDINE